MNRGRRSIATAVSTLLLAFWVAAPVDAGQGVRGSANRSVSQGGGAKRGASAGSRSASTGSGSTSAGSRSTGTAARTNTASRSTAANTNTNRNTTVDRNTNVNRSTSVNVSRDVDIDVDDYDGCCGGCCHNDHPVAAAMAVTAAVSLTAAAIGSIVSTPPPNCVPVNVNGVTYQQCGNTWYQPQMSGSSTTYVVVNPPQ